MTILLISMWSINEIENCTKSDDLIVDNEPTGYQPSKVGKGDIRLGVKMAAKTKQSGILSRIEYLKNLPLMGYQISQTS